MSILKGYAREQAYFKVEQEADIQRHKQRLEKEGRLGEQLGKIEGSGDDSPGAAALRASEESYQVLAEVHQQRVRIDDPHALTRRQFERRVKAQPPELTEEERLRYGQRSALGAGLGHIPKMSLGRSRYQLPQGCGQVLPSRLSPEAAEVAARAYVAGVRSLAYGSLLGLLGVGLAGTAAVHLSGVRSSEDFRGALREALLPLLGSVRSWALPLKARAQAWVGRVDPATGPGVPALQRRLGVATRRPRADPARAEGPG